MNNITPVNPSCGCAISKTIPSEFDNSLSYMEILMQLCNKTNEIISIINDVFAQQISAYIDERFNDMMIDAMYDSSTETLVLSLSEGDN